MKKLTLLLLFVFAFCNMSACAGDAKKDDLKKEGKMKSESEYKKRKASNPEIEIVTDFGTMKLELYKDVAPVHVDSMLARIKEGFYTGLIFHRIIDGFMIQGGDPSGNGTGNAGYNLEPEFSKLKHLEGTLSMARTQALNGASCQFFICLGSISHLDNQYTIFGQLMEGYDVLHAIGSTETGRGDKPVKDVYMRKVSVIKDIEKEKSDK